MKMGAAMFWGILLILIGLSFIFRVVFNIDFPVIKIIIAFFFIFLGLKILFGNFGIFKVQRSEHDIVFGESHVHITESSDNEYNVIFGKGVFDLRDLEISNQSIHLKVNTIFGGSEIKIREDIPLKIKADAVFAGAQLPGGNTAAFGTSTYLSPNFNPDSAYIFLKIDVVFGGVDIKTY